MQKALIWVLDRLVPEAMRRVRAQARREALIEVRRIWMDEAVRGLEETAVVRLDCPGNCDRTK